MKIAGVASALPKHKYDQMILLGALKAYWGVQLENPVFLERLHARVGVETRSLALPLEVYPTLTTWEETNNHWIRVATELGEEALTLALDRAGLKASDLSAIFFVSVTGICSPSIDAKLVNRMGLSPHIKRVPIFGLGCVAGAAGISRAADYVRGFPDQYAALVSVELCSLTLQKEDLSVANLISCGLFGDGAGAVIVGGANTRAPGPSVLETRSIFYPDTERVMGWDITNTGFKIVLSREVPEVVDLYLARDVAAFLGDSGLKREDIHSWIIHTGGPRILEATEKALEMAPGSLEASWACLSRTGNLSSASVLCVLEEFVQNRRPPAGSLSVLAAMGPGFCSELLLLRW